MSTVEINNFIGFHESKKEIFYDIPNYEGYYQISNLFRVKSLERECNHYLSGKRMVKERILKQNKTKEGYSVLRLHKDGFKKTFYIHQLVAMAFLNHNPNRHDLVVDHVNNDKNDNRPENLQLISNRENSSKNRKGVSKYTGVFLRKGTKGTKRWFSSININRKIKYLGSFEFEFEAFMAYEKAKRNILTT